MSSDGALLIIGATGNQGSHVIRALQDTGRTVYAFTRHPHSLKAHTLTAYGAHLVQGDLADMRSLRAAIKKVTGVFSVQNFWDVGLKKEIQLGDNIIQASLQAGNYPYIVYSSGLGAEHRQTVAAIDGKAVIEQRLRNSGLPFTILRPGLFMDDFRGISLPFARPIQSILQRHRPLIGRLFLSTLRSVIPTQQGVPLTSLRDLGRMAAWTFQNPQLANGRSYDIVGSVETASALCQLWEDTTNQAIPYVPGLKLGIRIVHPRMAALLMWLGHHTVRPGEVPIDLQTYGAWLLSSPLASKLPIS